MDAIFLEASKTTPKIIIDSVNNKFEISGESRPENTAKFYAPVITWLDAYRAVISYQKKSLGKSNKTSFNFKLDYFNSTSAKFILDIFYQLEKIHKEGNEVEIVWHYDKRDTDMRESGEEFSKYVPEVYVKYVEF